MNKLSPLTIDLEPYCSYLVTYKNNDNLFRIKCLDSTKTAYKIEYENFDTVWFFKYYFNDNYRIYEVLDDVPFTLDIVPTKITI